MKKPALGQRDGAEDQPFVHALVFKHPQPLLGPAQRLVRTARAQA